MRANGRMPRREARAMLQAMLVALEPGSEAKLPPVAPADLLASARRHRLSPLLSSLDVSGVDQTTADQFRRDRVATVARNMFLAAAADECTGALVAASVPVILLKGLAYEETIYPAAGVRPTGDVDILVPGDARRAAFRVLNHLGFEPRAAAPGFDESDYHEVAWTRKGVEVDLHLALAPLARCRIDYAEVWARARRSTRAGAEVMLLDSAHAAVFHALHMAIDHFDVPALYLIDFARLLPQADDAARAEAVARAWLCQRAFATTMALVAEFQPAWRARQALAATPWYARRVVAHYGGPEKVSRPEQFVRKLSHLDGPATALRYVITQGRRNAREVIERRLRKRSARERLALDRDG
jgi:Uncharacterised nucleotidyltransferase